MRTIEIKGNEKLKSLLNMKAGLNDEWIAMDKDKVALEEKQNKLALKMNRLNDKAQPFYREIIKEIELEEFEEHARLYIDEEDKILKLEIVDKIEEYKLAYRKKKEELLKKQEDADKAGDKDSSNKPNKKA